MNVVSIEEHFKVIKPKITIEKQSYYGDNICWICKQSCAHKKTYIKSLNNELPEVNMSTTHNKCLKLVNNIHKKRVELEELEFELFCKQASL